MGEREGVMVRGGKVREYGAMCDVRDKDDVDEKVTRQGRKKVRDFKWRFKYGVCVRVCACAWV